jgi:hypothetical protein
MVSSAQKRRAAGSVVKAGWCSRRKACRFLWLARSTWHYVPLAPTPRQTQLEKEILALSHAHPRYGYRRIHAVLPRKGLRCALRTVQRVRRREGLQILGPAVRPKCPSRPDVSGVTSKPATAGQGANSKPASATGTLGVIEG